MTPNVSFTGVTITRLHQDGPVGQNAFDGKVTYHVKASSIEFIYVYAFSNLTSVEVAVANGAAFLKADLDALSAAATHPRAALSGS